MKCFDWKMIAGLATLFFLFLAMPVLRADFQQNAVCPVMPGERISEKFHVDYQGMRIYLCCRACVRVFKRHPERYMKRIGVPGLTS